AGAASGGKPRGPQPLTPEVLINTDHVPPEQSIEKVLQTLEGLGLIDRFESASYTPQEEAMIRKRLKDMGYL
ncbi:MAG: hypothetical protein ACE5E5_07900, partial [Phycisphaerae bacterium]